MTHGTEISKLWTEVSKQAGRITELESLLIGYKLNVLEASQKMLEQQLKVLKDHSHDHKTDEGLTFPFNPDWSPELPSNPVQGQDPCEVPCHHEQRVTTTYDTVIKTCVKCGQTEVSTNGGKSVDVYEK